MKPILRSHRAACRISTKPIDARSIAIDRRLDPRLTERFRADLAVLLPASGAEGGLGIALSGGPDSLALLLLAAAAFPGRVQAATVDHGLREASADEAQFAARICAEHGIPHAILTTSVAEGNLQAEARRARYAALADWAAGASVDALLTAHHADDQAETLLMRLNRGSGVSGLAGVRERGSLPGGAVRVLRPLLGWRKSELEAIVAAAGIDPVRDPSNEDARFDRARIRKALAEADWLDAPAMATSAANLADAAEALDWAVGRELDECVALDGAGFRYRPSGPFAIRLRVLALLVERVGDRPREGALARIMRELSPGGSATIAGALLECHEDGWLVTKEPPRSA